MALGLGADYFFSPHIGVGLEVQFKGQEYSRRSVKVDGKDVVTDVDPKLDGQIQRLFLDADFAIKQNPSTGSG